MITGIAEVSVQLSRRFVASALILLAAMPLAAQSRSERNNGDTVLLEPGRGLHDAARASGGHYKGIRLNTDGFIAYQDLKSLAQHSNQVIVGTAVRNECKLSPDGKEVQTHYKFRVEEKLKGSFQPADLITVVLPGGEVRWDDGTSARISTPDFRKMTNGMRYLLFLQGKPKLSEYIPTGGSQGIVLLKDDGTAIPLARHPERKITELRTKSHHELIEAVRVAVQDSPHSP